jgi:hypothetical protein
MSDLERTIRESRDALPEPDDVATERARQAVLAAPRGRRHRRRVAAAIAFAAALAGAFVLGLVLAPGGATKTAASGPGFLPAPGWETFQTGLTTPPRTPTATAANVTLGPDVLSETFPWQTVAGLRSGQVLLEAIFYETGAVTGVDAHFRPHSLPLELGTAERGVSLEGQPPNVTAYRLDARVNGWNLDLFVFFGGSPTPAARAAAQDELNRLVVPKGPRGPLSKRPALQPSRWACPLSALRANVRLQGATGSLLGSIVFRNTGQKGCIERGRPTVELRDAHGALLATRQTAVPPLWRQLGATRPRGWPNVYVAPHGIFQVFVQLQNWCVVPVKPVFFHTYLPGVGAPIPAPTRITLRCDDPHAPVSLSVGPVEPPVR